MKVLWQGLYIVNRHYIGVDTGRTDCESAVPVLVRGCIRVDTGQIDCDRALPVLKSR